VDALGIDANFEKVDAYTIPFEEYKHLDSADLSKLFKEYIVLGVYEWIQQGVIILIKR